jgi:hypothetical protein
VSVLSEPISWLVRSVSWLPAGLRPGAFALALIVIVWTIGTRYGALWAAGCRSLALIADAVVGWILLPEYVVTSMRRHRGRSPGPTTLVIGDVFERALDGAAVLYERHARVPTPRQAGSARSGAGKGAARFPWRLALGVVLVPLAAWIAIEQAPESAVADWAARGWAYWEDLEEWAGVESVEGQPPPPVSPPPPPVAQPPPPVP